MLNVDLRSTLLTLDIVQASLTLCSLNRNVNLLTVQCLADDVILSYHISLLMPLLYLYVWLLPETQVLGKPAGHVLQLFTIICF